MLIPTNPYTAGDPVGKTSTFVGREDVLREVLRVLRRPQENAITLYGQRRIGKTSILQYLELHLPERGLYHPVYFDLMDKTGHPLNEILHELGRTIALCLGLPDPAPQETTEQAFRETFLPHVLQSLPEQASLVLLLDEFDVLADPQAELAAKQRFFGYMRDLRRLAPKRLQFVFVLGRNIDDLDIVARGLFKDLPSKRVSFLSRKDAVALVRLSERDDSLRWTDEAVARVWALTAGHPYLTQALCSRVWEEAHNAADEPPPVRPEDVDAVIPATLEASRNMFEWLWDGLGAAEKIVASALAAAGPQLVDEERLGTILTESGVRIVIGELRDAPKLLQRWDILAPADGGGYRFRVELLRRWIVVHKPLSRTQEELDRINPLAENLFNAASGYYRRGDLEQAEDLLRRALRANPNHLRAHKLLAEILLAQGGLDESQKWLERLDALAPNRARPRLKPVHLQQAEKAEDEEARLRWYEKILAFAPDDPQAVPARQEIYRRRAEQAMRRGHFQAAMEAYRQIGDEGGIQRDRAKEVLLHRRIDQAHWQDNGYQETEGPGGERSVPSLMEIIQDRQDLSPEIEPQQYDKIWKAVYRSRACWIVGSSLMGKTTLLEWIKEKGKKQEYDIHFLNSWYSPQILKVREEELKKWSSDNKKHMILMEEFDNLFFEDKEEVGKIFSLLRALYDNESAIIAASYRPISMWGKQFLNLSKILKDTFETIVLQAWEQEDIEQYLGKYLDGETVKKDEIEELAQVILSVSGGIPSLVYEVVNLWSKGHINTDSPENIDSLEEETLTSLSGSNAFSKLWQGMPEEEQAILLFTSMKYKKWDPFSVFQRDMQSLYRKILLQPEYEQVLSNSGTISDGQIVSRFLRRSILKIVTRKEGQDFSKLWEFISNKVGEYRNKGALAQWEVRSLYGYMITVGIDKSVLTRKQNGRRNLRVSVINLIQYLVGFLLISLVFIELLNLMQGF